MLGGGGVVVVLMLILCMRGVYAHVRREREGEKESQLPLRVHEVVVGEADMMMGRNVSRDEVKCSVVMMAATTTDAMEDGGKRRKNEQEHRVTKEMRLKRGRNLLVEPVGLADDGHDEVTIRARCGRARMWPISGAMSSSLSTTTVPSRRTKRDHEGIMKLLSSILDHWARSSSFTSEKWVIASSITIRPPGTRIDTRVHACSHGDSAHGSCAPGSPLSTSDSTWRSSRSTRAAFFMFVVVALLTAQMLVAARFDGALALAFRRDPCTTIREE